MVGTFKFSGVALTVVITACGSPAPTPGPAATKAVQTGVASFYGREFAGQKTASGERLRLDAMTAASRTLPIGTHVQVVNVETGQSAKVRINDRGPYAENRLLDLTPKAAERIGIEKTQGLAKVAVTPVQDPVQATP